ncbi:MAG: glycosyltransferase family 39 protein [Acidimicrobiia bacterium]
MTGPSKLEAARRFGLLLLLAVALHAAAFAVDLFNPDEAFLGTQGRVILDGGSVYDDTTDRKAPIVPYLYAGAFEVGGDGTVEGPRVLAILALALTAFLTYLEGRARWGERAGRAAGVLCLFASVAFLPGDAQAANFELFMLPATVAAVMLARRARWVGSGVAAAVAVLVKQTGGTILLPIAYLALRDRGRQRLRSVALVGAGFAVPIAITALLVGVGEYLRWNVLGNGDFASPPPIGEAVQVFFEQWGIWIGLNAPIVLLLVVAWRDHRREREAPNRDTDLWLWLLAGVISLSVGWRFYGHYFLQLAPAAALLIAGALARRATAIRVAALAATGAIAVGCAIVGFVADPADLIRPEISRAAARAVRGHSEPDDRLLVWGLAPEVYWEADRLPATRFVTTMSFLAGVQPSRDDTRARPERANRENWDDFVADFDAHPPQLVLDTAPADLKDAGLAPIRRYPSLATRIEADYCFLLEVRGMHLYERRAGDEARGDDVPGGTDALIVPPCST